MKKEMEVNKMKGRNLFWGFFFVIAAIFIILYAIGGFADINVWSLALTLVLLPIIFGSCVRLNFFGILFPIAILAIIYAQPLGITNLTPWPVLITALFGSIGFSILFRRNHYDYFHTSYKCHHKNNDDEHFSEVIDTPDSDAIEYNVKFSSAIKYVNTDNFKKANFSCKFGALKIYFDNAKISGNEAQIYLEGSFSGIELYIPKSWKLVNDIYTTASGVEEKNRSSNGDGPTVTLSGNLSFSGVEIIYV